jgi:hypothetical protein
MSARGDETDRRSPQYLKTEGRDKCWEVVTERAGTIKTTNPYHSALGVLYNI